MAPTPGTFCWFECGSTDAAAAREFYTRLFGWDAEEHPMPAEMGGVYTLLQREGKDVAGLYQLAGPHFEGVPSHWMSYVAVESADASTERAKSLGATILSGPMDVPGVGRMSFLTDPTGASIALFQAGEHRGADPEACNLGWCELHTRDTDAAREFYTRLFGWTAKPDAEHHYTEWQVDGRSIGGMMAIPPERQEPPHWLPYALVADCDATLEQAGRLGGRVLLPGQDIPQVGRFGVLADPSGAVLAVIRLDAPA